ncbi:OprD family porin [Pseudomonas mangrovi]|uniref:Outer membrane porin, OprD family n=1 Tax=Pseudomonas mangrovi TaxID=2161748 RepID=A0A2T5P4U6_9PSED|nr:OprD family porin [Pseudomonas mangrovi]PTU72763.1 outer membrane porin, OprD family [Pseudomonas mangrovi]
MHTIQWSALALAVAATASPLAMASQQSESKGFVDDSTLQLFNRALYMNREHKNGADSTTDGYSTRRNGYSEETGLGLRLLFESGFTQGTVGVGVDAHSLTSVKLDSGKGRAGLGLFSTDSDGRPEPTQSEVGGALKLRLSNTVLKHGNQIVDMPVLSSDDTRLLPEVATGTLLTMQEIENLEVVAGRFTALSSKAGSGRDSASFEDINGNQANLKSINLGGVSYAFSDDLQASVFASRVEDTFSKRYINLNYSLADLELDLNAYRTKDTGRSLAGEIDNTIWSLGATYNMGAHALGVAYQRSSGKTGYVYGIDGAGAVYLGNSVQISDFDSEDERSWQVRYDLDMKDYGVPGLSFMTRYVRGTDINWEDTSDGKETEWNLESAYVVQSGQAKDLTLRLRYAAYRANGVHNANYAQDMNDLRVFVEYPLNFL